jgi:uncharacterized protein (DUF4415 family)
MKKKKPDHISQEDWDAVDSPPLTKELLAKMRPVREVAPELIALQEHIQKQRGRPKSVNPKIATQIRLSAEVVEFFKAKGRGWQTRIDAVLRGVVNREKRKRG